MVPCPGKTESPQPEPGAHDVRAHRQEIAVGPRDRRAADGPVGASRIAAEAPGRGELGVDQRIRGVGQCPGQRGDEPGFWSALFAR